MAERGAHLTATEQEKPSIFEVVAADSLHATFNPAIKRLCMVLAARHPEKFGWTIRNYDELFFVLNASVQQYYVRQFGGSLSEIFYDLTRHRVQPPHSLTPAARWLLFASLVVVPYARLKLERVMQRFKDDDERIDATTTARERWLKRAFVRACSTGIGIYECLQVLQYIAYMANTSASHSLAVRLLGQQLVYASDDAAEDDSMAAPSVGLRLPSNWGLIDLWQSARRRPAAFVTATVFRGLELSAFFLQFIRWWTEEASQAGLMCLPVPEAPSYDSNSTKYMGICPLCVQSWEIPTAVSISGYVYCYKCIVRHMEGVRKTCPVSKYPADVDDLIRVFEV